MTLDFMTGSCAELHWQSDKQHLHIWGFFYSVPISYDAEKQQIQTTGSIYSSDFSSPHSDENGKKLKNMVSSYPVVYILWLIVFKKLSLEGNTEYLEYLWWVYINS